MAVHPKNGPKKPTSPMTVASFHFVRKICGSSSAPARKVRTMAPVPARKLIQPVLAPSPPRMKNAPITSCATVPTTISLSAVEILNQIAASVAIRASPTHTEAKPHIFSMKHHLYSSADRCRYHDSATNNPLVRSHQLC